MRKIFSKIMIIILMLFMITSIIKITENISKAASYNFNLTGASTANLGDTLTFTITANGLTGNVKLSGSNVSLSNSQVWVEKNTVTFTAKVTGFPASVTATPIELTDNDYNIISINAITKTITEIPTSKPQEQQQPETNSGGQTANQGGSSNPGTNQGQSSNVPTPPTTSNQGSNSSGTNQNYGTNSNSSHNQGTTSQVQTNPGVTSEGEIKSSNNYLKNLQVSVGTLNPEFYRETFEYSIDNIIEDEIEITAEAEDEKAVINGIGTIALIGGENRINIEVIAENEQVRTYTIIINKIEEIKESDIRLNSLEIQTINEKNEFNDLDIGFDKEQLDYRVTVDDNVTDLSILATVEEEGIIIETEGDKNLKEGENTVTITLTNQNEIIDQANIENNNEENSVSSENINSKTIYTIKVTRKAKPIVEISNSVYEMQKKKIIAGIILAVILISLTSIAVILHIKKKNQRKYKKKKI